MRILFLEVYPHAQVDGKTNGFFREWREQSFSLEIMVVHVYGKLKQPITYGEHWDKVLFLSKAWCAM